MKVQPLRMKNGNMKPARIAAGATRTLRAPQEVSTSSALQTSALRQNFNMCRDDFNMYRDDFNMCRDDGGGRRAGAVALQHAGDEPDILRGRAGIRRSTP
jgi:hypothetical protein